MATTWQQEQAESERKRQVHQDRVSGLVLAIQDLLEGQPVGVTIEALEEALHDARQKTAALEKTLQGLYRLRDEGRR